ncbi:SDR family oxidoreductase [Mesorhizobium sp. CU2]|uniref:SDR family NAD(P)-dependent oxidoreductase n=1 Tax=unclassified Mesorhizobium TaxID=325217 RepID=UPI00112BC44C|nr:MULTISPECIES: SDR family oxidoreductase [unclassified Mesorhizobium]TPN81069.1 SDR family oxidoreductase [Mesorhizobium sp. CU3]TPO09824.1 SDR family oxidoreductase [Mesorhizobium sp. CU2]
MPKTQYSSLKDRTVLVTGGASGIGESIARAFHAQGCSVAIFDYDVAAGELLARDLGDRVCFEHVDVRDIPALRSAIRRTIDTMGAITILVNNAARDDRHTIDEVTPEFWRERFATNLDHQFFAAQAVAPDMAKAGGGSIINMGSTSYMISSNSFAAYKTAKSAVVGLTRALARELGSKDIRVNCLVPGWIMTQRQIEKWLTPEGEKELLTRQCLKRKLMPQDIANFALFLGSDDSSAMSAQTCIVDGGWA